MLMGKALGTGKLVAPDDGPLSWTAHTDLAESAVMTPTGKGHLEGLTPSLTGSEGLDLAAIASELFRRKVLATTSLELTQKT
jgi:hypothetical protein